MDRSHQSVVSSSNTLGGGNIGQAFYDDSSEEKDRVCICNATITRCSSIAARNGIEVNERCSPFAWLVAVVSRKRVGKSLKKRGFVRIRDIPARIGSKLG